MLISSVSLCPSSLRKAKPLERQGGITEQLGWKPSRSKDIQAMYVFPAGRKGSTKTGMGALTGSDTVKSHFLIEHSSMMRLDVPSSHC